MSNRQIRNQRKAAKRRNKLLAPMDSRLGYGTMVELRDYGHLLVVSVTRYSDGERLGLMAITDRLFRRMDGQPMHMLGFLMSFFDGDNIRARAATL